MCRWGAILLWAFTSECIQESQHGRASAKQKLLLTAIVLSSASLKCMIVSWDQQYGIVQVHNNQQKVCHNLLGLRKRTVEQSQHPFIPLGTLGNTLQEGIYWTTAEDRELCCYKAGELPVLGCESVRHYEATREIVLDKFSRSQYRLWSWPLGSGSFPWARLLATLVWTCCFHCPAEARWGLQTSCATES